MSSNLLSFDCFASEEACQRTSSADKMVVISGESQIWRVRLNNLSTSASCQIAWRLTSESDRAHFDQVTFNVRNSQEELWEGSLEELVDQSFIMQAAFLPTSTQELSFIFIFKQQRNWQLLFDLHLDLSCQELDSNSGEPLAPSITEDFARQAVLGAGDQSEMVASSSSSSETVLVPRENYWPWAFCLCGFVFFVIMRLIHGKKKKNRQSFASLKQQKK